jgi:hypothetical protein
MTMAMIKRSLDPADLVPRHARPALRESLWIHSEPTGYDFDLMVERYRNSGGITSADTLARLLDDNLRQLSLASLLNERDVFGFHWLDEFWVPMFQFDDELTPRGEIRRILVELDGLFTSNGNWPLARWFIEPCGFLQERKPLDVLNCAGEITEAAHRQRVAMERSL